MKNRKEIEELAKADVPTGGELGEYSINGFVNGFEMCRNEIAEIIQNTPNDGDLGRKLRSLFLLEKQIG